jgi:YVTN family beta-propeller protein
LFINKDTLEIEDELIIFSAPSDIELDDGKLYIPLSGSNKVTIIDIDTRSVYKNIITDYRAKVW